MKQLKLDHENRVFAGVCAGLGNYFEVDPNIVRALFVAAVLFAGTGVLFYIVLWIVMALSEKN